jgi:hypothetical protein
VPSDPGPDDVNDEPPFGSLQFTVLVVLNALLDLDSNRIRARLVFRRLHCHLVCSSTGHCCLAFFLIGGRSRLLLLFIRVESAMMCGTIVVLQYCRRSVSFFNYWYTDTCTRT